MQTTPTITNPEGRILSILRPGEMVRFVLVPDKDRKIEFGIEGASTSEEGNALMAERLSLVLGEMRNSGYAFGRQMRKLPAARPPGRRRSRQSSTWVEIRPQTLAAVPTQIGPMGFSSPSSVTLPTRTLRVPDLPPSLAGRTLESPASLVAALPQIEQFEIEFVRTEIPDAAAKQLEESLRLQNVTQQAIAQIDQPTLSQVFLASWLWHRTGWKVTARARLSAGVAVPVAPLEMIGRDLFTSECEVVASRSGENATESLDLRNAFPRGWPFPPILPHPDAFDSLAASRLHNMSLPELPRTGVKIGIADGVHVRMPDQTRDRHTYIAGANGTGKSTLLERMITEDIRRGEGVILLDPHGDLFHAIRNAVPESRKADVIQIDPLSDEKPPGINFLDVSGSPRPGWRLRFLIGELLQFFDTVWNMRECGGPMFEMYFRNAMLLLADQGVREKAHHTLLNFASVLSDEDFRNHLLEACRSEDVKDFWTKVAERAGGEASLVNIVPYVVSKVDLLIQSAFIREMIGHPSNTLQIGKHMDKQSIVLCNLSKGILGATESRLLGYLLTAQIFSAGLERGMRSQRHRKPVNIYVDEFQNFVSDNVASMLSEARKFGLRMTLANQTLSQLKANSGKQDLLESVLGNVGNMVLFRLGVPDAERMASFIEPFSKQEIQQLPNFHALVRLLTPEGPVRPLIMKTLKA